MQNFQRFFIFLLFPLLTPNHGVDGEDYSSGAEYLQTAIRDIVIKNAERNILSLIDNQARIVTTPPARRVTPSPKILFDGNRRFSGGEHQLPQPDTYHDYLTPPEPHHDTPQPPSGHGGIPSPPSLTKGELAALYEAAVSAGHAVHMTAPGLQDSMPVQAALHEIRDTTLQQHQQLVPQGDATDGYYYYYYPLKSFLDGGAHIPKSTQVPKDHYKPPVLTSYNTHLHNVKVEPIHTVPEAPKGGKALEPLFMAISSFVGMAVMFVFSMVLWPRLRGGIKGAIKGKNNNNKNNKNKKKTRDLQDFHVDWPGIVRRLVESYSCKTCRNYGRLAPYRTTLSRTGRTKSKK